MTSTYMGFHFLWFLPTMLMVIVVRDVYFNVSQSVKMLIVLIAFCFWLLESLDISGSPVKVCGLGIDLH